MGSKLVVHVCWVSILAVTASAGTVKPLAFSDLVARSDLIVVGTASSTLSRWENGGKTIRTHVAFSGLQVLKGAASGGSLTLRLEGGVVGGTRLTVSGMPRFVVGKRYLLFVRGNGVHVSPITGYNQGVFEVVQSKGRTTLKTLAGLEVIGLRDDRLVLAGKRPAKREVAPVAVRADATFKPAHPDAEALEAEIVKKRAATRPTPIPRVDRPLPSVRPGAAAPPPPVTRAAQVSPRVVSPSIVSPAHDRGERLTLAEMVKRIERKRGRK